MLKMKERLAAKIADQLVAINPAIELTSGDIAGMLEYPPDAAMGDLALPCFKLSKSMRRSPVQIATELAAGITDECVDKVENLNGYLNFYLNKINSRKRLWEIFLLKVHLTAPMILARVKRLFLIILLLT